MNTPTPETDALTLDVIVVRGDCVLSEKDYPCGNGDYVHAEFARKLESERNKWKANHDNQVGLKRMLMDRPDLKERAKLISDLITERDHLRKVCDELFNNLSFVASEQPENDILCADGFTMSFHKDSPLHKCMKRAIESYNNLPHVKK